MFYLARLVSEGLKSLAKGIETLAKQVDGFQVDGSGESAKDTSAAPKADATKKAKPPAQKKAKSKATDLKKEKPTSANETVLRLIRRSKNGIATATLCERTGFNKKKVQNIVYRLKKQGQIKAVAKGVYGNV